MGKMICEIAGILLLLITLGLIGISAYLLKCSMDKPIWDRLPYWAISALLIIVASFLIYLQVLLLATNVVDWCEW